MTASTRRSTATLSLWSFIALATGLALGIYGFETGSPGVAGLARAMQPAGVLWLNALQMAVLPLVVFQLLTAISGNGNGASLARAGRNSLTLIIVMLGSVALVGYLLAWPAVRLYTVSPAEVEAIRASVLIPTSVQDAVGQAPASSMEFLLSLVPTNAFEALVQGNLLQILLVTVVFALAVNRLPEVQRKPLAELFRAGTAAMMIIVRWILWATPVGVFALVMGLALGTGSGAVELLGFFVIYDQGILLVIILLLYPVAALLGRVSMRAFARAALPAQLVAISTRSSIASMPAQIESGRERLGFSQTTAGFVVPLMVAALKVQSALGNSTRVLFLAYIFGVALDPAQLVSFTVAVLLISLATVGVPNGGGAFRTLPAYVAIGIPVEGLVLLQAVKDLRDYMATLANTTGQFAAATILSRRDRSAGAHLSRESEKVPEPAGVGP